MADGDWWLMADGGWWLMRADESRSRAEERPIVDSPQIAREMRVVHTTQCDGA